MRTRTLAIALLASISALGRLRHATGPLRLGVAGTIPRVGDTLNVARIRFVNATAATVFDVAQGGVIDTGNGSLRFGMSSRCVTVVASSPVLDVRQTGTQRHLSGLQPDPSGRGPIHDHRLHRRHRRHAVHHSLQPHVHSTERTDRLHRVQRRLDRDRVRRVRHRAGVPLTTYDPRGRRRARRCELGVRRGRRDTPQQIRITTANSTTVVLDLGNVTFVSDVNTILVIAPPLPGTTAFRAFLVAGC